MTDARTRALGRAATNDDPETQAAHLQARLRDGTITRDKLTLAAYCGHAPSLLLISYQPGTGCGALAPDFNRARDEGYPGAGLLIACQWHTPGAHYPHGTAYHHAYTWADSHGHEPFGAGASWPDSIECWLAGLRHWPTIHQVATSFLMPVPCGRSHDPGPRHEDCIEKYLAGLGDLVPPRIRLLKRLILDRALSMSGECA